LLEGLAEGLTRGSETWKMTSQTCGQKTDQVLRLTTSTVLHILNNTGVPCTKLRAKDLYLELLYHHYIFYEVFKALRSPGQELSTSVCKAVNFNNSHPLETSNPPSLEQLVTQLCYPRGPQCVYVCVIVCLPDNHLAGWLAGCLTRYCLQNSGKLAITSGLARRFAQTCKGPGSLPCTCI